MSGITAKEFDGGVRITGLTHFSVAKTFDCGQAFRFDPVGGEKNRVRGIACGREATFSDSLGADGEYTLTIENATMREYESVWRSYLALDEDYGRINEELISSAPEGADRDEFRFAVSCGDGIRILRQDKFETLVSFIVSQNNNIPRIKKIIAAMCEKYGRDGAFPTPEALCDAGEDGLFALRCGFRAAYIYDAARKVADGAIDLGAIDRCADYGKCAEELMKIKGVGPKVSACALLFGFGKTEAFPVDVWMKKALAERYSAGFDPSCFGRYAGIAQQYIFYRERYEKNAESSVIAKE